MAPCISFATLLDKIHRTSFSKAGLQYRTADLGDGTVINSWVPRKPKPQKPNLVLIPGFGTNAVWQWHAIVAKFIARFNVYVPDLIFFGDSYTTCADRTEGFQAKCLMGALRSWGVSSRMSVVGMSYGGSVAYSMAAQFQEEIESVVLVGAGVCWEETDMEDGMCVMKDLDEFASIMMPQTSEKFKELFKATHYRPPRLPSFFLNDLIHLMWQDNIPQRKGLIDKMLKGRKLSDLPKIHQSTLIIWGEHDGIFPLEMARRLVRHLDEKPQLVIVENAGHAVNAEKPKQLYRHIKAFLVDQVSQPKQ